ncbi:hypothetical protein DdX_06036 [Ditylenchus destructor]|uniref:Uncharacterized protein n=1 Tax=Ditylenchus destructor TaxID=166010 RepID=A0AAD4N5I2_9BILA|nr:hypothetical protein DdX_06036 [Ditylenchus destructor]
MWWRMAMFGEFDENLLVVGWRCKELAPSDCGRVQPCIAPENLRMILSHQLLSQFWTNNNFAQLHMQTEVEPKMPLILSIYQIIACGDAILVFYKRNSAALLAFAKKSKKDIQLVSWSTRPSRTIL